jgi:hypothetical protein
VCSVWISEQTATFSLYNINRLNFITEVESVYSMVCTESLYNRYILPLKGKVYKGCRKEFPPRLSG